MGRHPHWANGCRCRGNHGNTGHQQSPSIYLRRGVNIALKKQSREASHTAGPPIASCDLPPSSFYWVLQNMRMPSASASYLQGVMNMGSGTSQ